MEMWVESRLGLKYFNPFGSSEIYRYRGHQMYLCQSHTEMEGITEGMYRELEGKLQVPYN